MVAIAMLDSIIASAREILAGEDLILEAINPPRLDAVRASFDVDVTGYCIDRFCEAELDSVTPGNRGVGRMTDYVPRYGAYFRKFLSRMPATEKDCLKEILEQHLLSGYLTCALLAEEEVRVSKFDSGESLFERWIPAVYSEDPRHMAEELKGLLILFNLPAHTAHKAFHEKHGMKGGGLFRKDKSSLIEAYYPLAGFGLRITEVGAWG